MINPWQFALIHMSSQSVAELFVRNGPYDYLIAGGGTAGLALAARLVENSTSITVGVLEIGEDRSDDVNVQLWGLALNMTGKPEYDWNFASTPQVCLNFFLMIALFLGTQPICEIDIMQLLQYDTPQRTIAYPRGRQMGGSSGTNIMYWNHPVKEDLDDWANLGNPGWSWLDCLEYFLKTEIYEPPSPARAIEVRAGDLNPKFHGTNGSVMASYPPFSASIGTQWLPTYQNLDLVATEDPYSGKVLGAFSTMQSQDLENVTRSYAATAYYKPNKGRRNLAVLTGAYVNRILFQSGTSGLNATGLNFTHDGVNYVAQAKREVISSLGVVKSPQVLELSGIGNRTLLESLGITCLIDNPGVGENLQDHQNIHIPYAVHDNVSSLDSILNAKFSLSEKVVQDALEDYETNLNGSFVDLITSSTAYLSIQQVLNTTGGHLSFLGKHHFQKRSVSPENPGYAKQYELVIKKLRDRNVPNIQLGYSPFGWGVAPVNISEGYVTIWGILSHGLSRGSIHINSSDPMAAPVIDPKFLTHPLDLELLEQVAMHVQRLAATKPLSSLLKHSGSLPAPPFHPLNSTNVKNHVLETVDSFQHPLGTCAMQPEKSNGVVSPKLVVYGTENLRVVDSSIFPLQPIGTIQTLAYMTAFKAADMILEEYSEKDHP